MIFQNMIDDILREFKDKFVFIYIDDILIYLKNLEEYKRYIRQVLQRLVEKNLLVYPSKSEFYIQKTIFLGFEIILGKIRIELVKIQIVRDQLILINRKEVKIFIRFINLYKAFIKGFSNITKLLYELIGKGKTFKQIEV